MDVISRRIDGWKIEQIFSAPYSAELMLRLPSGRSRVHQQTLAASALHPACTTSSVRLDRLLISYKTTRAFTKCGRAANDGYDLYIDSVTTIGSHPLS